MEIKYIKGDATEPIIIGDKYSVICHCCNALGAWGKGFVVPLGQKYPIAREKYLKFIKMTKEENRLGSVSFAKATDNIIVANIIGQYYTYPKDGKIPLDYEALEKGFKFIIEIFKMHKMPLTVHMPKIGCGLAGGDWNRVEEIIKNTFINSNIEVYVYLL
jgi:O-acetyl-ADP-ribose deacetylase (regulator of RNase III)